MMRKLKAYQFKLLLTRNQVEETNKAGTRQSFKMKNGATSAVKHFPQNGVSA